MPRKAHNARKVDAPLNLFSLYRKCDYSSHISFKRTNGERHWRTNQPLPRGIVDKVKTIQARRHGGCIRSDTGGRTNHSPMSRYEQVASKACRMHLGKVSEHGRIHAPRVWIPISRSRKRESRFACAAGESRPAPRCRDGGRTTLAQNPTIEAGQRPHWPQRAFGQANVKELMPETAKAPSDLRAANC